MSVADSGSFIIPPASYADSTDEDAVDSLPSTDTGSLSDEGDDDEEEQAERARRRSDAEREWRESLQQLELMLTMVVVPYLGKYFGRKCAYWGLYHHSALPLETIHD